MQLEIFIRMNYINILLIATLFGLILATLLIKKKDVDYLPSWILSMFYFIFSIYCFQTYIIEFGILKYVRWFYGWPLPLYALLHVPLYFYFGNGNTFCYSFRGY